jgi:hypothetical protein
MPLPFQFTWLDSSSSTSSTPIRSLATASGKKVRNQIQAILNAFDEVQFVVGQAHKRIA